MNMTMTNLANDSLLHIEQQLTVVLLDPSVKPSDVGLAAEVFETTRTVAYNLLIGASDSHPGYEELDFPRAVKDRLARVDRLIKVAKWFGECVK